MRFAVGDLESDPFSFEHMPHVFASGFFDGRSMEIYYDDQIPDEDDERWYGKDASKALVKKCQAFGGDVYFHNGGRFDIYHLLDFLPRRDLVVDNAIGARLVKVTCGETSYIDSYSILPSPLKTFDPKVLGYEKFSRAERAQHKEKIIEHLKQDLRVLFQKVTEFFDRYGKNLTLATAAFRQMEKRFGVKIPDTSEHHDAKFRPWYFAGRVQFFGLGKFVGNYRIVDINSAFPYGMTFKHWGDAESSFGKQIPKLKMEQSFYHVRCIAGGALPFRENDGSVSFPLGEGEYYCIGWELKAGIEAKAIKALVILGVWTPDTLTEMAAFVHNFYGIKKQAKIDGDKTEEYFAKILLNAGYGKFAIQPNLFRDVAIRDFRKCPCGKNHVDGPPCKEGWEEAYDDEERGLTFYNRKTHEDGRESKPKRYYNVCTAASITSFVRAMLFKAARKTRPLYCDTDSLICPSFRDASVPQGDGLGEWKLEMECDVVWIGGKKIYAAHNKKYRWEKGKPTGAAHKRDFADASRDDWFHIPGHGWSLPSHFKTAAKGVRLKVPDLISVCEGAERETNFIAPSYSPFSPPRFVSRKITRADKRLVPRFPAKMFEK
jgi:DNA polymerase type B, organellar and viral